MVANPSESASRIPNITALRIALQYGDQRLPRCDAFNSSLTLFRKSYITSTGMRGMEVRDWKSAEHQTLLTEMSHVFLDRDGNGVLYWPTDATSPNYNSLQYANQHSLIRKCVKELLYRLNVQQYRNAKYRRKGVSVEDDNDDPHERPVDSIEIFSGDEAPRSATEDRHVQSNTGQTVETVRNNCNGQGHTTRQAEPVSTVSSHPGPVTALEDDVFEIPDDSDWVPSQATSNASKRRLRKSGCNQRPKRAKPCLPRRAPKRAGIQIARDLPARPPVMLLNEASDPAPDLEHMERTFDIPQGNSAAPFTESSVTTPMQRTPEELINYIRSNRPLTTLKPTAALESDHTTVGANVEPPVDPALEKVGTVSSTRLSSGSREDDLAPSGSRDLERSRHTISPTAPPRTVPDSEEPPEQRAVDLTDSLPTHESSSMCADAVKKIVQIKYRLVLMHNSIPVPQAWAPKGNLLDKTLQSLEVEIPLKEDSRGFVLRLRAPDCRSEHVIDAGDEFGFECAKDDLNTIIRRLAVKQMRTQPGKAVPMLIEIEPRGSNDDEGDMMAFESVKIEW